MIVSIMQPGYIPWLGFFELMARVNTFVIYDDVDYDKESWRNRNRIRTPEGYTWMTVPVITKGRLGQKIIEVEIDNRQNWRKKHLKSLVQYYSKAPYFRKYIPFFEDIYGREWNMLFDLDMEIIKYFKNLFKIETKLVYSSQLKSGGQKTKRLVAICDELNASIYISANGAKPYLEVQQFDAPEIKVEWQEYEHPVYPQVFDGFISHLSIVDLLFNCGEHSFDIITSGSTSGQW
ncbi:MAG: WbqC family protein [Negativicutes bacterium]|nr:WbqC family protein [Negativicutes bacterium]